MSNTSASEAIFFFDESGVEKEMLYQEFEAFLDGMIPMPDLAGVNAQVAYVNVANGLNPTAIVFFHLAFGVDGMADESWNMPLRSLAEKGIPGPDMGAGPIKIAMKSKNPLPAYEKFLWDPMDRGGSNDLLHIRDAVLRNRLCISEGAVTSDDPKIAQITQPQMATAVPLAPGDISSPTAQPVQAAPANLVDDAEFSQATKIIESQRLRVATLESNLLQGERNKQIQAAEKQKLEEHIDQLNTQLTGLQADLGAAKERQKAQDSSLQSLEGNHGREMKDFEKQKRIEQEKVEKHYQKFIKKREKEVTAKLKAAAATKDEEIGRLELKLTDQNKELTQLRGDKYHLLKGGSDDIFDRIAKAGLSFMTFRPGAGHMTIPLDDISRYLDDPVLFTAEKCNMSLEAYEYWLDHFKKPECKAPIKGEELCCQAVKRIDFPSDFTPGKSDRCDKHISAVAPNALTNKF